MPYAPGGTTDLLARLIASKLSAKYERQVVVENKTGAGGNIAAEFPGAQPARRLHADDGLDRAVRHQPADLLRARL